MKSDLIMRLENYILSRLTENVHSFEHYQKKFASWEATEQIIDDNKAFWMLRKPGSQYQKVCLYRDGCNMFIYGDYGQFTFDSMTWKGDVYNLEYNNIGYQMEKLNYESKQSLKVFDDDYCKEDILDWFESAIENNYSDVVDSDEELNILTSKAKENLVNYGFDVDEFCEKYKCEDLRSLLDFTDDLLSNTDEYEWISYLRNNTDRMQEFDEPCESSLWNAGKRINQRYFICMYALKVCGEKLKERKEVKLQDWERIMRDLDKLMSEVVGKYERNAAVVMLEDMKDRIDEAIRNNK